MHTGVKALSLVTVLFLFFYHSDGYCSDADLRFLFSVSRLTDGTNLRDPSGLDVSESTGDIFVADTGSHQLRIFSADGVLLRSVGRTAGIQSPFDVAVGPDGDVYITEMNASQITRLDSFGRLLPPLIPKSSEGPPSLLGRIFVDAANTVYVADRSGPRVFVISGPEQTVRKIEQTTDAESEWKVQDVTVDAKGTVYIVSSQGTAVHVYRRDGSHIRSFGRHGPKDDEFSFPVGAAIGPDGNLWIADSFRHELKVFTPGGRFLFRWGKTGMDDGELFYPVDIAFGKEILYVLEKGASRLQAFEMPGRR